MYRAFRRRVVEKLATSLQTGDRPGVDDCAATLHSLHRGPRHIEVTEDVRAECPLELFVSHILDRRLMLLVCGVVDQNVDPSKCVDRCLYRVVAESGISHVAG